MGLNLGNYRGLPIVDHSGALSGYRTELLRFPNQKFSVICLCNLSDAVPETLARKVAELYLANQLDPGEAPSTPHTTRTFPIPPNSQGTTSFLAPT